MSAWDAYNLVPKHIVSGMHSILTFNNRLDIFTGIGFAVDASLLFGDNLSIVRRFFMRSMIIRKNNVSFSKDHDWKKKKKKT